MLWVKGDLRHNYVRKAREMIADGELKPKVGLGYLRVYHDDWCKIFSGGFCNCDPHIVYKPLPERKKREGEL